MFGIFVFALQIKVFNPHIEYSRIEEACEKAEVNCPSSAHDSNSLDLYLWIKELEDGAK
jgi:hypothetical protein